MPIRTRLPKIRGITITAEAVAFYRRGRQLQREGREDDWDWDGGTRREYLHVCWKGLHRELRLSYGEISPLDAGPKPPSWNNAYTETYPKARELRLGLEEALKESRASHKPASAPDADAPV